MTLRMHVLKPWAFAADGRPGWKVTDQLAFNLLLDRNIVPIHVRHCFLP